MFYLDDLLNVPYPDIPFSEQKRIADFLDLKCAEIDSVIGNTEATIEEYKKLKQSIITEAVTKGIRGDRPMKDSGIEWIGEIPEEWDVEKGKHILIKLERPVKDDDGVITCFRDGEVTLRSKRREEGFTFSLQEAGYQGIEPEDLVVHGMDGFAGAIGISDSRGKATPVLNVLDSKLWCCNYIINKVYNASLSAVATSDITLRKSLFSSSRVIFFILLLMPAFSALYLSIMILKKCVVDYVMSSHYQMLNIKLKHHIRIPDFWNGNQKNKK